jgi:hypothetical protein
MSNTNRERAAGVLLPVGILILARIYWVYSLRWLQGFCPNCNLAVEPLDTVRLLAGMPIALVFGYVWRRTVMRWAKGAQEVIPVAPMTVREKNARLAAILVGAVFAGCSYGYLKGSMRVASLCCNMDQWPFQLMRCCASMMLGLIVYYLLGLAIAIGRWVKKPPG